METTTYLVTDPCYLYNEHAHWLAALDNHGYDGNWKNVQCDIGTIIESATTANGDGHIEVNGNKEICVDSGTVCIVRIDNMDAYNEAPYGNAITTDRATAGRWYRRAQRI